jgi:hypothetical protein
MNRPLTLMALVLGLCAACGGSTSTVGGTADAGTLDTGSPGDGGCIEQAPTQGSPCTPDEVLCNPGNFCCGGQWSCNTTTHKWNLLQGGCACEEGEAGIPDASSGDARPADAGSLSCGTLTCDPRTEYCSIEYSPIQGPTSYACVTPEGGMPSCGGMPTASSPGACGCYESPNGEVTIALCPP